MRDTDVKTLSYHLAVCGTLLEILFFAKNIPFYFIVYFFLIFIPFFILELRGKAKPLGILTQVLLISPALFFTALLISSETIVEYLMGVLLIITLAKIVGDRKPRDILQIYLLNHFMMVGAAVIKLDITFGVILILEATLFITGLIFLYASSEEQKLNFKFIKQLSILGFIITTVVLIVSTILFIVLPRPQLTFLNTSWGESISTGLSSKVNLREVEALKEEPSVAYRIKWIRGKPNIRYFRVFIYSNYNNGVWNAIKDFPSSLLRKPKGEKIVYEILPAISTKQLPCAGYPLRITSIKGPKAFSTYGGLLRVKEYTPSMSLYRVVALKTSTFPKDWSPYLFTFIPQNLKAKLIPLAEQLKKEDSLKTAIAVQDFLKKNYTYTLNPRAPKGEPTIWFLFKSRRGHCEYFASAMTLLLRSLGIPARVVGGYLARKWNPLGRYFLIRAKDAHTWVEVWIENRGWVTFDPTPPEAEYKKGITKIFDRFLLFIDYLQFKWYYWVIDYNFEKQLKLLEGIKRRFETVSIRHPRFSFKLNLPLILVTVMILFSLILYKKHLPPHQKLILFFEKRGIKRKRHETLKEFLEQVNQKYPSIKDELEQFLELYHKQRFGNENTQEQQKIILKKIMKGAKDEHQHNS